MALESASSGSSIASRVAALMQESRPTIGVSIPPFVPMSSSLSIHRTRTRLCAASRTGVVAFEADVVLSRSGRLKLQHQLHMVLRCLLINLIYFLSADDGVPLIYKFKAIAAEELKGHLQELRNEMG